MSKRRGRPPKKTGEKYIPINIRIPPEMLDWLNENCPNKSAFIVSAIQDKINEEIAQMKGLKEMTDVKNQNNVTIDFDTAVLQMDDDLRESLHMDLSPCSEQAFFSAYEKAHLQKFGEVWELAKKAPTY